MKYARITLDPSQGVNYYEIKFSRLDKQGKSFSRLGAEMWNCIPLCIRKLAKQSFGKKINDCLLQILSQTNDYHDLPTLLGQMQHVQNRPQLTHSYIFAIILTVYL